MEQYYKSYYLKEHNKVEINFVREMQFGLKVFTSEKLGIRVGEMINDRMDVSYVIYYNDVNSKAIQQYHESNYPENTLMGICEELSNGTKISYYIKSRVVKYSVDVFYEDGKPKLRQEFNENFELVEYVQSIYDEQDNLVQEKIFYADSWTIHTEKMIL